MLTDGTWIFLLEGLLALMLAVLIVWWTLPSKRGEAPPDSTDETMRSETAEPSDPGRDARQGKK